MAAPTGTQLVSVTRLPASFVLAASCALVSRCPVRLSLCAGGGRVACVRESSRAVSVI